MDGQRGTAHPAGPNETGPDETPVLASAQTPSHLKDGSRLQEDNLRSQQPGQLRVDEGQLVQGTGKS